MIYTRKCNRLTIKIPDKINIIERQTQQNYGHHNPLLEFPCETLEPYISLAACKKYCAKLEIIVKYTLTYMIDSRMHNRLEFDNKNTQPQSKKTNIIANSLI